MSKETLAPEIETKALTVADQAAALLVHDQASAMRANEYLRGVKGLMKEIADFFRPLKQKADETKTALLDAEKAKLGPLQTAERLIKSRLLKWQDEEETLRLEEERRLREKARKREEEARLAEAVELEQAGAMDEAEALLSEPVIAPVIQLAAPKLAGSSTRTLYRAVVSDFPAFLRHVAGHPELRYLVTPNQTGLDGMARSLKEALNLPGVTVQTEKILATARG